MILQLMFKRDKPDEEKLKEKLSHRGIIRPAPADYDTLVTTKVDDLIWQGLRPQTRFLTLGIKLFRLALCSQSQFYKKR